MDYEQNKRSKRYDSERTGKGKAQNQYQRRSNETTGYNRKGAYQQHRGGYNGYESKNKSYQNIYNPDMFKRPAQKQEQDIDKKQLYSKQKRLYEANKKKEEKRKKQIQRNRIIVLVSFIVIVLSIVFLVRGCVKLVTSGGENEQQPTATQVPVVTVTPRVVAGGTINQDYFKNSAFIGNSFVDGMEMYELIDGADYFGKVGGSVKDALNADADTGKVLVDELNGNKTYDKIFMVFGENELGWANSETFKEQYKQLIEKVKTYQPQAQIYLFSITPVSKKVSDENVDNTNNEQIVKYNRIIKSIASEEDVIYADIYSAVVDSDGALPENAASDGVHFDDVYYKKVLLYVQNNYKQNEQSQSPEPQTSSGAINDESA